MIGPWCLARQAQELFLRFSIALYGGVVPDAGGKPVDPAPDPGASPTAVATSVPGATDASGGTVDASSILTDGTDISLIVLILAGIFAAIGFFRGSRREFYTLAIVLPSYLLFSRGWPAVAGLINQAWRVANFVIVRRGMLADNLGQAWTDSAGVGPLIATSSDAPIAQLAVFGVMMVVAYMMTRPHGEPSGLERIVGAMVGGVIGYVAGVFVLSRIVPDAKVSAMAPGSAALTWLERLGPMGLFIFMGAVILFGFRSLGPGRYSRRFGG